MIDLVKDIKNDQNNLIRNIINKVLEENIKNVKHVFKGTNAFGTKVNVNLINKGKNLYKEFELYLNNDCFNFEYVISSNDIDITNENFNYIGIKYNVEMLLKIFILDFVTINDIKINTEPYLIKENYEYIFDLKEFLSGNIYITFDNQEELIEFTTYIVNERKDNYIYINNIYSVIRQFENNYDHLSIRGSFSKSLFTIFDTNDLIYVKEKRIIYKYKDIYFDWLEDKLFNRKR
jgi:hypothetical protein